MYVYTDSRELQDCPAAVDMETGDIYINLDVWDRYTEAEKQFILGHELGHYMLDTDDEEEADQYALQRNFGKVRKSLKSSFTALEKAGVNNEERWGELYENALEIDADNGNDRAAAELKKIKYKTKKTSETMRNIPGQITYIQPDYPLMNNFCRADGDEGGEPQDPQTPPYIPNAGEGLGLRRQGVQVGSLFLKVTDIILIAIGIILLVKLN